MMKRSINIIFVLMFLIAGCSSSDEQKLKNAGQFLTQARRDLQEDKFSAAIGLYEKAIAEFKSAKSDSAAGEGYLLLADCQRSIGQFTDALGNYQNATESLRPLGKKKINRKADLALAKFYLDVSQNSEAAALAENISVTAKVFSDMGDVYAALSIAAQANHNLGKYNQEQHELEEMMQIDASQNRNEPELWNRKLVAYFGAGRYDMARATLDYWVARANTSGDAEAVVRAYDTWGIMQRSLSRPDSAFRAFSFALSKMDRQMDKNLQVDILSSVSGLAYGLAHYEDARRYASDALTLAKEADNIIIEQLVEILIAACDWKLDRGKKNLLSENLINRCSSIEATCRQTGYPMGEALSLFINARISEQNDSAHRAISLYRQALQIFEQIPCIFNEERLESQIVNTVLSVEQIDWYDPVLRKECADGNTDRAFELLEQRKMSDIQRFYSKVTIRTPDENLNQLIGKLRWNNNGMQFIEKEIEGEISRGKKSDFERIRLLKDQMNKLRAESLSLMNEFRGSYLNYQYILSSKAPTLMQIQDVLQSNQILVDYVLIANNLYILAITHDTSYMRPTSVDRQRFQTLINEYNRFISDTKLTGIGKRIDELSSILGEILLKPIAFTLKENSTVFIAPPKEFGWLPIHTLEVNGFLLGERADVSYLPSAGVLLFATKKESTIRDVIGIGHPGLTDWDVGYELKDIRSFYDSAKIFLNQSATLKSLESVPFDILQVTAEFHLDCKHPNNSVLILSDGKTDDGLKEIPLGNLFSIPAAQVLVMSNVSVTNGELMLYAPLAFLANGTPTVIATMWQGERRIKRYFGEIFYTNLHTGVFPTEAYRSTVLALQKKSEYREANRWGMYYRFGK